MSRPASPFRQEALDFQTGLDVARGTDTSPQIDAAWTRWLYWALLALTVAGVLATLLVRTHETTSGPARLNPDQQTFVAVVPDAAGPALRHGAPVRLELAHPGAGSVAGTVQDVKVADAVNTRAAGLPSTSGSMKLISGVLADEPDVASSQTAAGVEARAVVELRSGTIFDLLTRQGGMLGGG